MSKSGVRKALVKAGVDLHPFATKLRAARKYRRKGNVRPIFGFCYFEGKVVPHPKEYPILIGIITRWREGGLINSIVKDLNRRKVKSPRNRIWGWNSVNSIIIKFEKGILVKVGGRYEIKND